MKITDLLRRAILLPLLPVLGAGAPGDSGADGADGADDGADAAGTEQKKDPPPTGKTFTQDEVTAMTAAEKAQGRRSVLKELGIEDGPTYKEALKQLKALSDSQKTAAELAQAELATAQQTAAEAAAQALQFQYQLSALKLGVNADYLEDVLAIAAPKVNETTTFEAVITGMKAKYAVFFSEGAAGAGAGTGTGTGVGGKRQSAGQQGIAERLTKGKSFGEAKKSTYFTN